MTARRVRHGWVLPDDDGIVDSVAIEIAVSGARPVALTRTERQLAAARILAEGGTAYVISKRLRVSGSTAIALAARSALPASPVQAGPSARSRLSAHASGRDGCP